MTDAFAEWFDREVEPGIRYSDNVTSALGPWSKRRDDFIRRIMGAAFEAGHEAALAADHERADALVAAAYEDAAQACVGVYLPASDGTDVHLAHDNAVTGCFSAVMPRTPADARAALDRLIAEAERRGAREAALSEIQRIGQEIDAELNGGNQ